MSKKDVLIVDLIGSIPIYTAYFARAVHKHGLKINVISPFKNDELSQLTQLKKYYKSTFDHYAIGSNTKLAKLFSWILNGFLLIWNSNRYKIIHITWLSLLTANNFDYYLLKWLIRINSKIFITIHQPYEHDNYENSYRKRLIKIAALNPFFVVHSKSTKKDLLKDFPLKKDKIIIIPHGPLYQNYKSDISHKSEKLIISMIGTIKPYKRVEDALKASKILKSEGINFKLLIAGKGEVGYVNSLVEKSRKLNIENCVEIVNRFLTQDEVIFYNKSSNCILAPYERISQSGAVVTALSLGAPVIGYSIGGIPELVSHKKNGYLAEHKDVSDLVNGIKWVIKTPKSKIKSGIEERLKENSWEKAVKTLREFY